MSGITAPVATVNYAVETSGTLIIGALLDGIKWGGATGTGLVLTYSFPYATSVAYWATDYSYDNEPAFTPAGLTITQQNSFTSALQQWANLADISFTAVAETSTTAGDIRVAFTSVPAISNYWGWAFLADAYYPCGGDIWINPEFSDDSWAVGSYNFSSLLHELGHALGLKHPFEGTPVLPDSQDSTQYTLMSYTDHPHGLYYKGGVYSYINPDTPMLYDIAAIQYLYGANQAYRTGNDTYSFNPADPFFMTIWDAGGIDTITVSNFSKGCIINLQAGHFSKITIESDPVPVHHSNWTVPTYDGTDNLAIAFGVSIENAVGGSGNDILLGNEANNRLTGGGGNDTITGNAGIDTAVYNTSQLGYYTLSRNADGSFRVGNILEGYDTLYSIERLEAPGIGWALDMGLGDSAGQTALVVGAAFGLSALSHQDYIGIGINLLDSGWSLEQVCQLAIGTDQFLLSAGSADNSDFVNLVYRNVIGVLPSGADHDYFVSLLQGSGGSMSQAQLLEFAATSEANQSTINLAGLQATGLAYL
jgi:Ca2+-binding RTX toxin-like protein